MKSIMELKIQYKCKAKDVNKFKNYLLNLGYSWSYLNDKWNYSHLYYVYFFIDFGNCVYLGSERSVDVEITVVDLDKEKLKKLL